jgi:hypothetical protein
MSRVTNVCCATRTRVFIFTISFINSISISFTTSTSFFFFLFSFFFFLFRFFCVALLAPQTARVQNDTFLIISQLLFNGVSVFGASAGGISPPAMCLITQNNFA